MKWVVAAKGGPDERYFEISVLRDDNSLGKESYGWFGSNKLLITHNGGPCEWPLTKRVWDKCLKVAEEIAAELNLDEPTSSSTAKPWE